MKEKIEGWTNKREKKKERNEIDLPCFIAAHAQPFIGYHLQIDVKWSRWKKYVHQDIHLRLSLSHIHTWIEQTHTHTHTRPLGKHAREIISVFIHTLLKTLQVSAMAGQPDSRRCLQCYAFKQKLYFSSTTHSVTWRWKNCEKKRTKEKLWKPAIKSIQVPWVMLHICGAQY